MQKLKLHIQISLPEIKCDCQQKKLLVIIKTSFNPLEKSIMYFLFSVWMLRGFSIFSIHIYIFCISSGLQNNKHTVSNILKYLGNSIILPCPRICSFTSSWLTPMYLTARKKMKRSAKKDKIICYIFEKIIIIHDHII